MQLEPGSRLGSYEIEGLLGRGAMGVVYRAYHPGLARAAAVKVLQALTPDQDAVARFQVEARAIASLRHPNIVNVFDFGELEGTPYMVVEFVSGGSLADQLEQGSLEKERVLELLRGIAAGLDYAHSQEILHRDVKPDNVLLTADGTPVLADFGLAKLAQSAVKTMTGFITGTPTYMAPEQIRGSGVGPATDRYSLACMAYELLTSQPPFSGEDMMALLYAHAHEPPPESGLGQAIDQVLHRALAKEPDQRWESSAAFAEALAEAMVGAAAVPVGALRSTQIVSAPLPPPRPGVAPPQPPGTAPPQPPGTPPRRAAETGSAVATLLQMGVPRLRTEKQHSLDSHFANAVGVARDICGDVWPDVAAAAGLSEWLVEDPPMREEYTTPVQSLSALNEAIEQVFGAEAPDRIRRWGRLATDRAVQGLSSAAQQRAVRMIPGSRRKLITVLNGFTKSMDHVRGDHTHTWKQIDDQRFWLVHFDNLYALGRLKEQKSCHVWTASFEAMLRWVGLANEWLVEEIECGCTNGSFNCVFAIRSSRTEG